MKDKIPKKLEDLIDIVVEIPSPKDMSYRALIEGKSYDDKWNAEQLLIKTIKILSKNTVYEDTTDDIIKKCQDIFDMDDK